MGNERSNIISVIKSPLGFFALSLLIVEGFLAISLIFSKGTREDSFYYWGLFIGAVLFLIVVGLVWIVVWDRPQNLTLEGKHHAEIAKRQIDFKPEPKSSTEITEKEIENYIKEY